jgi:predicted ATPase
VDLIGRDAEISELLARLRTRRLVTVTGAGGIGKTALATEVLARARSGFELGGRMIDLTVVDSGAQVSGTIAAQLGFTSFEGLLTSSIEHQVLLLIDNCEHVSEDAAAAIGALLGSCNEPTVLATSRSPLGLPGESLLVVGPLAVPGTDGADTPALQLLCDRAADAGARIGEQDRAALARLSRELDGIPLALELAAARLRTMTAEEILQRLEIDVNVLTRSSYRGAVRHRSVTETVRWSYDLLSDDLAAVFERLGIFAGPFTATTAHAVVLPGLPARSHDQGRTDDLLTALVEASLVTAEQRGPETWYRLLSAVRTFARHRLRARGAAEATTQAFVDHVVDRVTELIGSSRAGWSARHLGELLAMYQNIAAALRWTLEHDTDPRRSFLLCSVLWGLVHQAHVDDIEQLAEATLRRWPAESDPVRGPDAVATLATARYLLADAGEAVELAERTLPVAGAAGFAPVSLPRLLAHVAHAQGRTGRAIELFAEAIDAARARGLAALAMESEVFRASLLADVGRGQEALAALASVREEAMAAGAEVNAIWAVTTEGYVRLRVHPESAPAVIAEALDASRQAGYPSGVVAGLRSTAMMQLAGERPDRAAQTLLTLVDEPLAIGAVGSDLRMLLDVAAVVLARLGRPCWADLAATARAQPVVSVLLSVGHELFPLPDTDRGRVLSRRNAVGLVRSELEAAVRGAPGGGPEATAVASARARFVNRGELWEIRFEGHTVHVKSSKGLADLTRLLAQPGRELHCLELMGALVEESAVDEAIDVTARRQMEERVRDLQADIDQADADHDVARAERAREELDAVVDHLMVALGLAGRGRRSGSSAERARSAVTQRIRSTIRRLAAVHPELGRHLDASVTTGTFCCYDPEHPVVWQTRLDETT